MISMREGTQVSVLKEQEKHANTGKRLLFLSLTERREGMSWIRHTVDGEDGKKLQYPCPTGQQQ